MRWVAVLQRVEASRPEIGPKDYRPRRRMVQTGSSNPCCSYGRRRLHVGGLRLPGVTQRHQPGAVAVVVDAEGAVVDGLVVDVEPLFVEQEDVERELALDDGQLVESQGEAVPRAAGDGWEAVLVSGEGRHLDAVGAVDGDGEVEATRGVVALPIDGDAPGAAGRERPRRAFDRTTVGEPAYGEQPRRSALARWR